MEKKESRKNEILEISAKLFKEKGYTAVSMRDIAAALGIKASSLYNHIESKQDLLQEIILSIAHEFTQGMNTILSSDQPSTEQLKRLIKLHVKIAVSNPSGLAALNKDWMHLKDQLSYYKQLRHDYESNFRSIIAKGIQNQEIKAVNEEVMLFSLLSTLRNLYLWIPKKDGVNQSQLESDLTTILISGINM